MYTSVQLEVTDCIVILTKQSPCYLNLLVSLGRTKPLMPGSEVD